MSFKTIYRLNRRQNEYKEDFYLLKRGISHEKDELGFANEKFLPVQQIRGIVQKSQMQQIAEKGEESNPLYTGYFCPEFILDTSEVADYRIKYVRPHETLILKIIEYNPNLFLRGKRDHIQMELVLEKKYEES